MQQDQVEIIGLDFLQEPRNDRFRVRLVGFGNVAVTQLPLMWRLATPSDVFEAFYNGSARTGGLLRAQTPVALAKVHEAILASAAAFTRGDHLEIPMPALVVSARKP